MVYRMRPTIFKPCLSFFPRCPNLLITRSLNIERVDHLPIIQPGINSDDPYGAKKKLLKKRRRKSARPSYRFVDRCRLRVAAGNGGAGSLSLHRLSRKRHVIPDGGHGGAGGSVILVADEHCTSLNRFRPHVSATKGAPGRGNQCHGARGKNTVLRVPPGVVVRRVLDEDDVWDEENKTLLRVEEEDDDEEDYSEFQYYDEQTNLNDDGHSHEFESSDLEEAAEFENVDNGEVSHNNNHDSHRGYYEASLDFDEEENEERLNKLAERRVVTVADLDSPGNCVFAKRHGGMPNPMYMAKKALSENGEVAFLELELKLIADIGLVGFPNAGKSSLLRAMSAATPEVAAYPFTTLHPLIGCIEYQDGVRVLAADIPGLIDGASEGRGKGYSFLKHVERTKALLYIVDSAGVDFRDPIEDLKTLVHELSSYGDGSLMDRRALVVGNKVDLLHEDQSAELRHALSETALQLGLDIAQDPLMISAGVSGVGLTNLSKAIRAVAHSKASI